MGGEERVILYEPLPYLSSHAGCFVGMVGVVRHVQSADVVRMRSKFGRGSSVAMLVPTSVVTSLYVMVTSILIGWELVYGWLCVAQLITIF